MSVDLGPLGRALYSADHLVSPRGPATRSDEVPGADHGFSRHQTALADAVERWLAEVLGADPGAPVSGPSGRAPAAAARRCR